VLEEGKRKQRVVSLKEKEGPKSQEVIGKDNCDGGRDRRCTRSGLIEPVTAWWKVLHGK